MKINNFLPFLFNFLPEELIESVVWYGNKGGRDIDLFVILGGDLSQSIFQSAFIKTNGKYLLDVGFIGKDWVPSMVKNLDPIIVEPFLNGELVWGKVIDVHREQLLRQQVSYDVPVYLLECAEIFYSWAVTLSLKGRKRDSLSNLSFTYSYLIYALYYLHNSKVVLFKHLPSKKELSRINNIRDKVKYKPFISNSDLQDSFYQVRSVLTDLRIMLGYK